MKGPEEELVQTESNYVTFLEFLINSYLLPLQKWFDILKLQFKNNPDDSLLCRLLSSEIDNNINNNNNSNNSSNSNSSSNSNNSNNSSNNNSIIDKLFKNILQLHLVHKFLLNELLPIKNDRYEIVKIFHKNAACLIFYKDYISNSETSRLLLNELKQDHRFRSFIYAIELNPESRGLDLEAQLSKPWQRVMKYALLFKEILKRVTDSDERDIVTKTIKRIENITETLNKSQFAVERNILRQSREKFYDLEEGTLTGPARYFIHDGPIKIITHNSKVNQSLILCNDIIMIGKKKTMFSGSSFRRFDLQKIQVIKYPLNTSKRFIIRPSEREVISIEVESIPKCDEWIRNISELMNERTPQIQTKHTSLRRIYSGTFVPTTVSWDRKITVWETNSGVPTVYLLPGSFQIGEIIDHSLLKVYHGTEGDEDGNGDENGENEKQSEIETEVETRNNSEIVSLSISDSGEILDIPSIPELMRSATSHSYVILEDSKDETNNMESNEKYLFIDGIMKRNQLFDRQISSIPPPLALNLQPLAFVCTLEDVDLAFNIQKISIGYLLQISESIQSSIMYLQDEEYGEEIGLKDSEIFSNLNDLTSLFDQMDIPLGLLNELLKLRDYNIHFLIEDTSFMKDRTNYPINLAHEILIGRSKVNQSNFLSYWEYCESNLHTIVDLLSSIPIKSFKVSFTNSLEIIELNRDHMTPTNFKETLHQNISTTFKKVQKIHPFTKLYSSLQKTLKQTFNQDLSNNDNNNNDNNNTLHIIISTGDYTTCSNEITPNHIFQLIESRPFPEKNPMIFLPIGPQDKYNWMNEIVNHGISGVNVLKEYELEKQSLQELQGFVFPFTKGIWYLFQLISIIDHNNINILNKHLPLTKYSLDNTFGRVHTPKEYEHYFKNHGMYLTYKNIYEQLLFEKLSINEILSKYDNQNISNNNNLIPSEIESITNKGWAMLLKNSENPS